MERRELRELGEAVKARIDYRAFYLRYCRRARSSGDKFKSLCPIPAHEHSGLGQHSLSVDVRRGLWHCFSRDEGGDAIRFYELMHGVSFTRAVREMAHELGGSAADAATLVGTSHAVAWDVPATLPATQLAEICGHFLALCRAEDQAEGRAYLARRGIDAQTMQRAGVAYFPRRAYRRVMQGLAEAFALEELQRSGLFNEQGRLTFYSHRLLFPFYVEGRALYLQGRATAAGVEPRWLNLRGRVPALYNADVLDGLRSDEIVYLVEGFTDTLTLMVHGFHAVGIVGAGGFREDWLPPLGRFRVVAALDGDEAGQRAAARYRAMFAARGLDLAVLPVPTDVNDFFRSRPTAGVEWVLLTEAALGA
jgi:DNA primase